MLLEREMLIQFANENNFYLVVSNVQPTDRAVLTAGLCYISDSFSLLFSSAGSPFFFSSAPLKQGNPFLQEVG